MPKDAIGRNDSVCQQPGCDREPLLCYVEDEDKDVDVSLCPEHAVCAGYCKDCGVFALGQESFEMFGLCEDCSKAWKYPDWDKDPVTGEEWPDESYGQEWGGLV